jgi:dTDP-4-dehydrorhamnose 3,5-epimerase
MSTPGSTETDLGHPIAGVRLLGLTAHGDARGATSEIWRQEWFGPSFVPLQANRSDRRAGAVVGLHWHRHQQDLWHVAAGHLRVGLFDLRAGSPTQGTAATTDLRADEPRTLLIPAGVAHGFATVADTTLWYFVDRTYDPDDEHAVAWDDPEAGIDWGVADPMISQRDADARPSADLGDQRPTWNG